MLLAVRAPALAVFVLFLAVGASWASSGRGCLFGSGAMASFNLPLETQRITCPRKGVVLESYMELLETPHVPFRYPKGQLLRGPVMSARVMPAEDVEIQVSAPTQMWAFRSTTTDVNDTGDITLGTKWTAFRERGAIPSFGFRWAAKLPNASDETGLGTDETDLFAGLLVSKTVAGRVQLDGNLGLAIMGDPTRESKQIDVLTYGAAASLPVTERLAGVLEIEGASGKRRYPTWAVLRAGAVWEGPWPSTMVHGAFTAGLRDDSPEWGLRLGVGWAARPFREER